MDMLQIIVTLQIFLWPLFYTYLYKNQTQHSLIAVRILLRS